MTGSASEAARRRILLGQLVSNGDCLFATTVARQIKLDYPGCHLTWAIGSSSRSILYNNPDLDAIWEVEPRAGETYKETWRRFAREARRRKLRGEFDDVFLTQVSPDHYYRSKGTTRASLFAGYPHPITVPVAPVLQLSGEEVENVRQFAERHELHRYKDVILFESAPKSGQSLLSPALAEEVATSVVANHPGVCVILSSDRKLTAPSPQVIDGSSLSFRENAELSKYCSVLVGCSSGISWLCTSEWAKPLPMVQLLRTNYTLSPSLINDFRLWSLPTDHILEMFEWDKEPLLSCLQTVISAGFPVAKERFAQAVPPLSKSYQWLLYFLVRRGRFYQAARLVARQMRVSDARMEFLVGAVRIFARSAVNAIRK